MEMDGVNGILRILPDVVPRQSRSRFCSLLYGCGHQCTQEIQNVGYMQDRCLALVTVQLICGHFIENETYCYEQPKILMCRACSFPRRVQQILRDLALSDSENDPAKMKKRPAARPVPVPQVEASDSKGDDEEEDELMELGVENILSPEESAFEEQKILPFSSAQPSTSAAAGQQPGQMAESSENMQDMDFAVVEQLKRRHENTEIGDGVSGESYEPPFKKFGAGA